MPEQPKPRKRAAPRYNASDHGPWIPPQWAKADAASLQALQFGRATAEQQKRALDWIVKAAAGAYDMSYRPGAEDGRRDTDFAEGRRFVGLQIVKLLGLNLTALPNDEPMADQAEPK